MLKLGRSDGGKKPVSSLSQVDQSSRTVSIERKFHSVYFIEYDSHYLVGRVWEI